MFTRPGTRYTESQRKPGEQWSRNTEDAVGMSSKEGHGKDTLLKAPQIELKGSNILGEEKRERWEKTNRKGD